MGKDIAVGIKTMGQLGSYWGPANTSSCRNLQGRDKNVYDIKGTSF
jgi:hypothetical protein